LLEPLIAIDDFLGTGRLDVPRQTRHGTPRQRRDGIRSAEGRVPGAGGPEVIAILLDPDRSASRWVMIPAPPAPLGPAAKPGGRTDGAGRTAAGGGPGELAASPFRVPSPFRVRPRSASPFRVVDVEPDQASHSQPEIP
jgi:hypothetical protein